MSNPMVQTVIALIISVVVLRGEASNAPSALPLSGEARNAEDQFLLGRAYARGEGVARSYEQAGFWYRKAAEQGNLKAMHNLGVLYLEGKGTPRDEKQGYTLIKRAAEAGDPKSIAQVGILLSNGTGVAKDPVQGMVWLERGAKSGSPDALVFLARKKLRDPSSSIADKKEAVVLLAKAADQNDLVACGELSEVLAKKGGGVAVDLDRSTFYAKKGAELGDPLCRYLYARRLLITSPKDAYPWAKLAMQDHAASAVGLYQECLSFLKPEDVAIGDAEAERIRSSTSAKH
jgi:TPR repeat protein